VWLSGRRRGPDHTTTTIHRARLSLQRANSRQDSDRALGAFGEVLADVSGLSAEKPIAAHVVFKVEAVKDAVAALGFACLVPLVGFEPHAAGVGGFLLRYAKYEPRDAKPVTIETI
jgi:hypothetical protein